MRLRRKNKPEEKIEFPTEDEYIEEEEEEIEPEKVRKPQPKDDKPDELNINELCDVAIGNIERAYLAIIDIKKKIV